jgi:predicted metal-dependent HD superfamily phosphohydrolase
MPEPTTSQTWQQLCSRRTSKKHLADQLWHELETSYTAKGRYYHTLEHLEALLAHAAIHSSSIQDRDAVSFAIFYHDVIYSPLRKDNEEKSAELAVERLQQLGLPAHQLEHIRQMILATKAHTDSPDADTRLLLDFDLSVLGSDWETYLTYTRQIRKEYSLVPYFLYRKGRKKVLQHFLAQPRIYKTQQFYKQYEEAAKQNIETELQSLTT